MLTVDPVFIHRLTMIFASMLPIAGLLLYRIPLKGKIWFVGAIASFSFVFITFFMLARRVSIIYPARGLYLSYGLFLVTYLSLKVWVDGYDRFNEILGSGLFLTYIATEFWEIPVFFYAILGLYGKEYLGPFNLLYLGLTFFLLIRLTKILPSKALILPLTLSALIMARYPSMVYSSSIWFVNRFLGYIFLLWNFIPGLLHKFFVAMKNRRIPEGLNLDVGCGSAHTPRAVGLDLDAGALAGAPGERVLGDCHFLPFRAHSFDLAFCYSLFHHTDRWSLILEEMLRVGRKGLIFEHNPRSFIARLFVRSSPIDEGITLIEPWILSSGKIEYLLWGGQYCLEIF